MMEVEEETNSGSSDEEVERTSKELENQRHLFEHMAEILKAQQEALKQNLHVLQAKATKSIPMKKEKSSPDNLKQSYDSEKSSKVDASSGSGAGKGDKSENEDGSRRWNQSGQPRNYDTQICPICGAEFDDPENTEALEEHVAGHWCSSESN